MHSDGETAPESDRSETETRSPSGDDASSGLETTGDDESGVSWAQAGMAGVLGFEFVGLLVAGLFVGYYVDEQFQTAPVGMLVGLALGVLAAGLHIWRIAARLMSRNSDSET